MQLASSVQLERSPDTARLPRLKDLDAAGRVRALRHILELYRPLFSQPGNFTTLGVLTKGHLASWDAQALEMNNESPCLLLIDFDQTSEGRLLARTDASREEQKGKQLLLTPSARILVCSWNVRNILREPDQLFAQQTVVAVATRYSVASPDEGELGTLLNCSRLRQIHETLSGIAHSALQRHQRAVEDLSSLIDEAQEYMAS